MHRIIATAVKTSMTTFDSRAEFVYSPARGDYPAKSHPPRLDLYNVGRMARGWESKSVEAQQSEAMQKSSEARPRLSPEAAARAREKETLRLARERVVQQLKKSENPRHRLLLENELADLDRKLAPTGST